MTKITVKKQKKDNSWLVLGAGVVILALVLGLLIWKPWEAPQNDAEQFAAEYTQVAAENPFVYRNAEEIIRILEHGTGVVFLGFPECPWCQAYVKYLAEVARDYGVEEIYYYNILEARKENTAEYQRMVELLGEHLQYDEEGQRRIYVPNVAFVVEGEIIGNDWESSKDTLGLEEPAEYWTEERVAALKTRLSALMEQVVAAKGCATTCNE